MRLSYCGDKDLTQITGDSLECVSVPRFSGTFELTYGATGPVMEEETDMTASAE